MFQTLLNDPYIIDLYKKIEIYEDLNGGWAHHNYNHVMNVATLVEKVLSNLGYDKTFIDEAKVAALLHDIGCIEGKENHELKSYEMAKYYLETRRINLSNKDLVLDAIKMHRDCVDTDNLIALVLSFSDKLDIKHDRIAKAGLNIPGQKEMQYIKDIIVNIDNGELVVEFIADVKMNKQELENYYFMPKVFKAIENFAKVMNLNYTVTLNNHKWNPTFNRAGDNPLPH